MLKQNIKIVKQIKYIRETNFPFTNILTHISRQGREELVGQKYLSPLLILGASIFLCRLIMVSTTAIKCNRTIIRKWNAHGAQCDITRLQRRRILCNWWLLTTTYMENQAFGKWGPVTVWTDNTWSRENQHWWHDRCSQWIKYRRIRRYQSVMVLRLGDPLEFTEKVRKYWCLGWVLGVFEAPWCF